MYLETSSSREGRPQGPKSRIGFLFGGQAEESDATEEEATRVKGEHDEKRATARWHEGRSENRRENCEERWEEADAQGWATDTCM